MVILLINKNNSKPLPTWMRCGRLWHRNNNETDPDHSAKIDTRTEISHTTNPSTTNVAPTHIGPGSNDNDHNDNDLWSEPAQPPSSYQTVVSQHDNNNTIISTKTIIVTVNSGPCRCQHTTCCQHPLRPPRNPTTLLTLTLLPSLYNTIKKNFECNQTLVWKIF